MGSLLKSIEIDETEKCGICSLFQLVRACSEEVNRTVVKGVIILLAYFVHNTNRSKILALERPVCDIAPALRCVAPRYLMETGSR